MKKIPLSFVVLITTFLLGFFAFAVWHFQPLSSEADFPLPIIIEENVCGKQLDFPGLSIDVNAIEVNKHGYFPQRVFAWEKGFGWNERRDDLKNKWYSAQLKAMDEPPLFELSERGVETYRFLWLRSFHRPVTVIIERKDNRFSLGYKELNGAGGYDPGEMLKNKTFALTAADWCKFAALLEEADYWELVTDDDRGGNDGSHWIFEAVRDGRYHVVDRWAPDNGAYRNAGLYLLTLSGFNPESADEIY